jgi:hypothetical protein
MLLHGSLQKLCGLILRPQMYHKFPLDNIWLLQIIRTTVVMLATQVLLPSFRHAHLGEFRNSSKFARHDTWGLEKEELQRDAISNR